MVETEPQWDELACSELAEAIRNSSEETKKELAENLSSLV